MAENAHDPIIDTAKAWLAQDPDEITRVELDTLVRDADAGSEIALDELHSRFDSRLSFGTAGLRGRIGAGSARMNRVLVSQAAVGLAAFLRSREASPTVVIGYDGRTNSDVFARDTAELMAGAGVRAILLPRLLPTPVLAFAVRHLGASAGVMVTASHNPPQDNGYKVYLGGDDDGSQIVPPVDGEIAEQIERVAREENVLELPRNAEFETADESVVDAYVAATAALLPRGAEKLSVVYTAMHGVGWRTFSSVIEAAGYSGIASVPEQQEPDADFPTVSFPNPEEPGALDLSFALAREVGAELIIANDPDADRLSIAIPDVESAEGYRQLTGNEVGWLLGWDAARKAAASNLDDAALACTIVSSPALGAVAKKYGLNFVETLTGFKWVSRVPGLVFGYEEAIGYLVNPDAVKDKDGISAGVAFLAMAAEGKAEDVSVAQMLDGFTETFGFFASDQLSVRVTDLSLISAIMSELRENAPSTIGGVSISSVDDLLDCSGDLPPTDALRFSLDDGSRVMARPSGTEPKLKYYIDVAAPAEQAEHARGVLTSIRDDLDAFSKRIAER
ncbi:phospho-sugar mutase [Paramicrobacterium chengjingii]|uniref:Phospho-sugar mutase n=1 Tax=Paramicrobacterium chengjingii TaxID=2769067 RepID=A0ABX6YKQ8_9MICO|nr:phospho-sugar mutase [Microbacterium chengjingii]QPZ39351.1 phospho-sugar mutase [Microbacterium chengjingii]